MGKAIGAVVGVVEIAAGAVIDYATEGSGGNWLIASGVSSLLGYAASLLLNPHRSPLMPIGANYTGTLEPRRIIYGELTIGGMYATPPMTAGANNDYLDLLLVLAGHPITSYGDVYFNNLRIASADIAAPGPNFPIGGAVTNNVTNNGYEGLAWIRRYDGTQTIVDLTLWNTYTAWDANHVGHELAYAAVRLQYNQTAYATGVPNIAFHVKGKAIYDPRQDSTNGGSGSQRFGTPSTWVYSTNPALCLADYLTSELGLGDIESRIDWQSIAKLEKPEEDCGGIKQRQRFRRRRLGPALFPALARPIGGDRRAVLRRGRLSCAAHLRWDSRLVRYRA